MSVVTCMHAKNELVEDALGQENEDELEELGWDDAPTEGLVIVEWPEHAASHMPDDRLVLHFTLDDKGTRALAFEPGGAWIKRLEGMR